jgi:hypothetical protein
VSVAEIVLWTFAIVLAVLGIVFVLLGQNSERAYWVQRDPSGDARTEATSIGAVAAKAWRIAPGEYRAPLRIMAIGVILIELAIVFAIVAVVVRLA